VDLLFEISCALLFQAAWHRRKVMGIAALNPSYAYAASLQLGATAASHCLREENHRGTVEPATVCQACYDQLQERVDVLEAVLHMDVKEAAEVIYDAVWSDPSDPTKTYQNAAQAMLSELKKRSGITPMFGPLQPLSH